VGALGQQYDTTSPSPVEPKAKVVYEGSRCRMFETLGSTRRRTSSAPQFTRRTRAPPSGQVLNGALRGGLSQRRCKALAEPLHIGQRSARLKSEWH
jgi:hypothetical protein